MGIFCIDPRIVDRWCMKIEVECGAHNRFLYGYFAMHLTCHWREINCARIDAWLGLWDQSMFDNLVTDSHSAATSYLNIACRHQNKEQFRRTFSNLVLRGKLCKAVRFVWKREAGGVLLPNDPTLDNSGPTKKLSPQFLQEDICMEKFYLRPCWKCMQKRLC